MTTLTTHKMAEAHEVFLADLFGGRKTPGSGSQWNRAMDGRSSKMEQRFAFAWDGKSTLAKSIGVSLAMWDKAEEQAHSERPMLALRYYDGPLLVPVRDLVVVNAHDMAELLEEANR